MPLKRVDWSKQLDPLKWAVDKVFLAGVLNFLASLPGQGKTALLTYLLWQASRPNGGYFLGYRVAPSTSIYADYDAPGEGRNMRFWFEH